MKKVSLLFVLLTVLCLPFAARADRYNLVVADGTQTNFNVPIYGDGFGNSRLQTYSQHTQIIYPASMLTSMANTVIYGMKFHYGDTYSGYCETDNQVHTKWNLYVTVSIAEVSQTSLTGAINPVMTEVWAGYMQGNPTDDSMVFDMPYEYGGGNLLIDIQTATTIGRCNVNFVGVTQEGASFREGTHDVTTPDGRVYNFLPKATFDYGDDPYCPKPRHIVAVEDSMRADSVLITWQPLGEEHSAYFTVSLDGQEPQEVTDTFYWFTGIAPNTIHTATIISHCGNDASSIPATLRFRSACGVITDLPYLFSFENENTEVYPRCFTVLKSFTSNQNAITYPAVMRSSENNPEYWLSYDGRQYLVMATYMGSEQSIVDENNTVNHVDSTCVIALPEISTFENVSVTFFARVGNDITNLSTTNSYPPDDFMIGVIENDTDFVPLAHYNLSTRYRMFTIMPDTVYSGTSRRLAFKTKKASSNSVVFIDEIYISNTPPCSPIDSLRFTEIDGDSATFTWHDINDNADYWNVVLSTEPIDNLNDVSDDDLIPVLNTPTVTVRGLQSKTDYYLYVRSLCSNSGESMWKSIQFVSACGYTDVPYFTGFEADEGVFDSLPYCWERKNMSAVHSGITYPREYVTGAAVDKRKAGERSLMFRHVVSGGSGSGSGVLLPTFNNVNNLEINFFARSYNASTIANIEVGVWDNGNYEAVDTVSFASASFMEFTVSLESYQGVGERPYLRSLHTSSMSRTTVTDVYVDNVTVRAIPACPAPHNVKLDDSTTTTLDVTWESTAASFDVALSDVSTTEPDTLPYTHITANMHQFANLTANTPYYIYIRTICSNGDTSLFWTEYATRTARCNDGCQVSVTMTNIAYGGWSFNSFAAEQGGDKIFSSPTTTKFKANDGQIGRSTFAVCPGDEVQFKINTVGTTYGLNSCKLEIADAYGETIFSSSDMGTGNYVVGEVFFTYTPTCQPPSCLAPNQLTATYATSTSAVVSWNERNQATSWTIAYDTIDIAPAVTTPTIEVNDNPATISGLTEGTDYYVYVRANCSDDDQSTWAGPVKISGEPCRPVAIVSVSSVDSTAATISWIASSSSHNTWTIEYGPAGFTVGDGTVVTATSNPFQITRLNPGTEYDLYVATQCAPGVNSEYAEKVTFTTDTLRGGGGGSGTGTGDSDTNSIFSAAATSVRLFPNPATSSVTIDLSQVEGQSAQVAIIDMNGREVYAKQTAESTVIVDVRSMAKGAYFVRITNDATNAVGKLIVK